MAKDCTEHALNVTYRERRYPATRWEPEEIDSILTCDACGDEVDEGDFTHKTIVRDYGTGKRITSDFELPDDPDDGEPDIEVPDTDETAKELEADLLAEREAEKRERDIAESERLSENLPEGEAFND